MPSRLDVDEQRIADLHTQGWSYRKTADALGVSAKCVRNRILELGLKPHHKAKNLLRQRFGHLKVVGRVGHNDHGTVIWLCRCDCGREHKATSSNLLNRSTPSCRKCSRKRELEAMPDGCLVPARYWHALAERARKYPVFDLTPMWLSELFMEQKGCCALSDYPIFFGSQGMTASLDRIDSRLGYQKGNVQWVHKYINFMKQEYSQSLFIEFCNAVATKHPSET